MLVPPQFVVRKKDDIFFLELILVFLDPPGGEVGQLPRIDIFFLESAYRPLNGIRLIPVAVSAIPEAETVR